MVQRPLFEVDRQQTGAEMGRYRSGLLYDQSPTMLGQAILPDGNHTRGKKRFLEQFGPMHGTWIARFRGVASTLPSRKRLQQSRLEVWSILRQAVSNH
jgi:hypothetical protein